MRWPIGAHGRLQMRCIWVLNTWGRVAWNSQKVRRTAHAFNRGGTRTYLRRLVLPLRTSQERG